MNGTWLPAGDLVLNHLLVIYHIISTFYSRLLWHLHILSHSPLWHTHLIRLFGIQHSHLIRLFGISPSLQDLDTSSLYNDRRQDRDVPISRKPHAHSGDLQSDAMSLILFCLTYIIFVCSFLLVLFEGMQWLLKQPKPRLEEFRH